MEQGLPTPEIFKQLPKIRRYSSDLERQDLHWTTTAMLAKINHGGLDPQLLESIEATQSEFQELKSVLIASIISRYFAKTQNELQFYAQTFIDILIRNLFERTADVGFLATDQTLVSLLSSSESASAKLVQRLREYQSKYSGYRNLAIYDGHDQLLACLDEHCPLQVPQELLCTTRECQEYLEHFEIQHHRPRLFYAKTIHSPSGEGLGSLVMEFNLTQELQMIEQDLLQNQGVHTLLLDANNRVFHSSLRDVAIGELFSNIPQAEVTQITMKGREYLAYKACTKGFEGYRGLDWYSVSLLDVSMMLKQNSEIKAYPTTTHYPLDLEKLNIQISTALLIVILNGKIISSKRKARAFVPIR